jgi:4-diphosphocytidyl-2-C-methyl-D-erythritol kinase
MPVHELAHAKINLTLQVLGRRDDGYHDLESLVTFADIHDTVTLEPGAGGSVAVVGPFAGYIGGENLLVRAMNLLRGADAELQLGSVRLVKNLPVAAGIGGGSADAAAFLRAVKQANADRAASVAWVDIARRLGADVPVCFGAEPALVWGLGEETATVASLPAVSAVLVNPRVPLATADVFKALAAGPAAPSRRRPTVPELPRLVDLVGYMRAHGNGLERPAMALVPAIRDVKAALEAEPECRYAAMSGSGPTCFGIFADREQALNAARRIAGIHPGWWVQATVLQGSAGPCFGVVSWRG